MSGKGFETVTLPNGIRVHTLSTRRFKTVSVRLFMHQELTREKAAMTALLPMVLRRGTESLPTTREVSRHLEGLYGAEIDTGVIKVGECHVIFIHLDVPGSQYLSDRPESLLDQGLELLSEMVRRPALENGLFRQDYFQQERENLRRLQLSLINDKVQYAVARCIEEMCRDERYGVPRYGKPGDLEALDVEGLTEHFRQTVSSYPMDIYLVGDISPEDAAGITRRLFDFPRQDFKEIQPTVLIHEVDMARQVVEKHDINQAKLALGYRTGRSRRDPGFWALAFCDGILGGFPHSKLFMNVREKAGLAYYAFSKLEATKGLMTLSCGINFEDYNRALDIMNEQVEHMKKGVLSQEEMDYTLRGLVGRVKAGEDSPTGTILRQLEGNINGVEESLEDIVKQLENITRDDVVEAAQGLQLDTTYLLTKGDAKEVRS